MKDFQISLRINEELSDELDMFVGVSDISKNRIISIALEKFLFGNDGQDFLKVFGKPSRIQIVESCTKCGGKNLKSKGGHEKCMDCGERLGLMEEEKYGDRNTYSVNGVYFDAETNEPNEPIEPIETITKAELESSKELFKNITGEEMTINNLAKGDREF